jgi:hypothetical protein
MWRCENPRFTEKRNWISVSTSHTYYPIGLKFRNKGKAIPLQAWTGPEDSRKLRLPDFKTIGT